MTTKKRNSRVIGKKARTRVSDASSRQIFNVFGNGKKVFVQFSDIDLLDRVRLFVSSELDETWERDGNLLVIPREFPQGMAMLDLDGQPTRIARKLLELLKEPELWQHSSLDPIRIKAGIEVIERLALASMPTLSECEKANLREVQELCERTIRGELVASPSPENDKGVSKKLLKSIESFGPEKFFQWFDDQLPDRGRDGLRLIVKHWVKIQAGKHDFAELPREQAVAEKHKIARGLQSRLDQIGLAIHCKHVGRDKQVACGKVGRLNAELTGSSSSGQYLVAHNSSTGGKGNHMRTTSFPQLAICTLLSPS